MSAIITPEEFAAQMRDIFTDGGDLDVEHCDADDLLCKVLRSLGYGAGVDIFERADKWYA